MKISIRMKFFIVLLAFSLGPLFLSRLLMGRASMRMAEDLSEQTRKELTYIVREDLEASAVSLAAVLDAQGTAMGMATHMVSMEAGKALSGGAPPANIKTYLTSDFDMGSAAPPDAAPSELYPRRTRRGIQPLDISLKHPAFLLPHGVREQDVTLQMRQLRNLQPGLATLYDDLPLTAYWFNIGLESGVFMTYPGHGKLPMMYDYRDTKLYRGVRDAGGEAWDSPVIDPSTRTAMATVGAPIFADNGTFMGVASMDVPISSVINDTNLQTRWQGDIRSFMAIPQSREDTGEKGLLIIAQQDYDEGGRRHWMTGIEQEWLESDDKPGFEKLLGLMADEPSGVVELSYKGTDSVWAFSSAQGFLFLLITPKTVVTQLPDEIGGSVADMFAELRDVSAIIGGVMLIVTGLIAWFGSNSITRPLVSIARTARRLASGDFTARILMRTGDERDALIDAFNEMGPKLEEHLRISKDLELAQEVQKLLLPHSTPTFDGYDLSGSIAYCDQTGGDYYDFIDIKSGNGRTLGVVLGDVSGHGVPSALVMATARGQLHSLSQVDMDPRERIGAINTFLSEDLDGTGRFLTMFYLRLEEGSSTIRWVRAGHDPAIRYTPETDTFSELVGEGLPLGVMVDAELPENEDTLAPGEVLVLATDGVWEARNSDGEMYGKKRILAIIRDNAHKKADEIRQAIINAAFDYLETQEDDIAVVVIKKT